MYVIWFPVNILSGQPWVTITNNLWKLKERSIQNILARWYFFSISESETDDQSHTFISLQDVEEQIKSEFAEVLKKVSQTIATMCQTEKQAWLRMDEVEEECQRLTKQVETAAQKLVWYQVLLPRFVVVSLEPKNFIYVYSLDILWEMYSSGVSLWIILLGKQKSYYGQISSLTPPDCPFW